MASGYVLSDNPYGDLDPTTLGADPLYVPQLAVGRLVETPSDITSTIDAYVGTNGVRTPNASFSAAYDWMLSTGQAVNDATSQHVPAGSATPAQRHMEPPRRDQRAASRGARLRVDQRALQHIAIPSGGRLHEGTTSPNVLSTADLPSDLSNGVVFTLGCHAGLNVADTYIANPNAEEQANLLDWSEAVLRNGGVFQGPTGYGIGEKSSLAYSGRLLSLYANGLDGSTSSARR